MSDTTRSGSFGDFFTSTYWSIGLNSDGHLSLEEFVFRVHSVALTAFANTRNMSSAGLVQGPFGHTKGILKMTKTKSGPGLK